MGLLTSLNGFYTAMHTYHVSAPSKKIARKYFSGSPRRSEETLILLTARIIVSAKGAVGGTKIRSTEVLVDFAT